MNQNTYQSLYESLLKFSKAELLQHLKANYTSLVDQNVESSFPLTDRAFNNLSLEDVSNIETAVGKMFGEDCLIQLIHWRSYNLEHYRREILRYGCTVLPELMFRKTNMSSANPPPQVHSMQRQEVFAGDLYSGDMCVSALMRAGKEIIDDGDYLDFGCSSGSLVRNMWAGFPKANWYGSDPVVSSIQWARSQFDSIEFIISSQEPPLPFATKTLDGAYAISIWSHFSERAAVAWLNEIHRIIKPNGFLILTSHGIRSLYYYLEQDLMPQEVICRMLAQINEKSFAMQEVWQNHSEEADGLNTTDWGNSYFTQSWLSINIQTKWRILDFQPGLNQCNQDIYVIERI